ncbi:thioredoxin reductase [Micromonospora sp. DT4]|uniref:thioredoxin reductase n=1 Tax=Micromonospora sp. DT4 TaxID=3393438 RepID=UPI003CEB0B43
MVGLDGTRRLGVEVRDLRYKMIMALNAADLGDPICEQVAEICAEIAEQHCAEFGHTSALRAGEIAELATGEPALTWAPSTPDAGQRAW